MTNFTATPVVAKVLTSASLREYTAACSYRGDKALLYIRLATEKYDSIARREITYSATLFVVGRKRECVWQEDSKIGMYSNQTDETLIDAIIADSGAEYVEVLQNNLNETDKRSIDNDLDMTTLILDLAGLN